MKCMSAKKQIIAATADRVFYREGFAAVGVDRLVADAGVALATFYRHYPSKEDAVLAALRHREAAFFRSLERTEAAEQEPEAVLVLFDGLLSWAEAEGGNGCLFLRAAGDYPQTDAVRGEALRHKQDYLALIQERLVADGWGEAEAADLAPSLFLLLEGAVAAAFTLGDRRAVAAAKEIARQMLRARQE
ncbi:MAG: TetR family transcriptional regulator [Rhodospirillales bacterium]